MEAFPRYFWGRLLLSVIFTLYRRVFMVISAGSPWHILAQGWNGTSVPGKDDGWVGFQTSCFASSCVSSTFIQTQPLLLKYRYSDVIFVAAKCKNSLGAAVIAIVSNPNQGSLSPDPTTSFPDFLPIILPIILTTSSPKSG